MSQIMSFRKNLWNRLWNTVWLAPRAFWTWLYSISDATQTAIYWVLDPVEWIGKTASSIKEAVYKAFTQWKWYQKLWKAPASLAATPFMLIEWVWETLWHTWCNLFRNVRDTIANPFLNIWHSIKRMWTSRSVWDFRFDNINNMRNVTPEMKLASVFA
jgi:hypothetical protein